MRPVSVSRSALLLAASVAALAGAAHAQTTPPQEDAVEDVIVTGRPFGVTDNASLIAVDVLDEQALAVAPVQTLGDLVAGLPGVRSSSFAPGASRPVIRGLSGPRVQVLTNGIGMIDASAVSPDHQVAVDPAEANRIEIVRGPSTLTFGGSAIGGVVNILDERIPTHAAEGGVDGHVSTQYSSVDDGYGLRRPPGGQRRSVRLHRRRLHAATAATTTSPARPSPSAWRPPRAWRATTPGRSSNSFAEIEQVGAGVSYVDDRGFVGGLGQEHPVQLRHRGRARRHHRPGTDPLRLPRRARPRHRPGSRTCACRPATPTTSTPSSKGPRSAPSSSPRAMRAGPN